MRDGGGCVGLEFAQAMRRLGSRVTIIQQGSRLLEREDEDVSNAIQDLMRDEEIEVFVNSEIVMFRGSLETE